MATVRPESIPKQLPLGSVATSKSLRYDVLASSWTRDNRHYVKSSTGALRQHSDSWRAHLTPLGSKRRGVGGSSLAPHPPSNDVARVRDYTRCLSGAAAWRWVRDVASNTVAGARGRHGAPALSATTRITAIVLGGHRD